MLLRTIKYFVRTEFGRKKCLQTEKETPQRFFCLIYNYQNNPE